MKNDVSENPENRKNTEKIVFENLRLALLFISVYNLHQINVKIINLASIAGIRTHDLLN